MLADATARAATEGLNIEYRVEDAEKLSFPDASFDVVASTFGVMFVSRPEAAAGGNRARVPPRRPARSRDMDPRRQRIRDVQGHAALHAAAPGLPATLPVRMGPARAHPRVVGQRLRPQIRAREAASTITGTERRPGRRSSPVMDPRNRWPPISTRSGAPTCSEILSRSTRDFAANLASRCRGHTC